MGRIGGRAGRIFFPLAEIIAGFDCERLKRTTGGDQPSVVRFFCDSVPLPFPFIESLPMYDRTVSSSAASPGVLVVVEGVNDVEFLRRISRILHADDPGIPDLHQLELAGCLVFVPLGGGGLSKWSRRLEAVGWPEFHLYDRDLPPETHLRLEAAKAVNARSNCQAAVTGHRALENYLHPLAIKEACSIKVAFSGTDSVAELVARSKLPTNCRWIELSHRTQKRLCYRAKKWLNTKAVDCMTPERLVEQDSGGEVVSWLRAIARLSSFDRNLHSCPKVQDQPLNKKQVACETQKRIADNSRLHVYRSQCE